MLARDFPETPDYHGLLGMTFGNLGWLLTEQKKWADARRLIEEGIEQMHTALKPNPHYPDFLQELRSQYQDLAETLVQLGDHAAAVQAATSMAGVFPDRAQDSYYAACFIARCVPLAAKDDRLARQYVERAVVFLRHAAGKAPADLKRLPDERQVFQPLAPHPDFGAVLRELDAKRR
jgi:hypothetical protein